MNKLYMTAAVLPFMIVAQAHAQTGEAIAAKPNKAAEKILRAPAAKASVEAAFSTGVAKGRDRLDSATSTSSLRQGELVKLGAHSLAEVLRNIPGVRTEYSTGEGNSNYTIRGLPLAAQGSKWVQIQEDGLPVLEFGDIYNVSADIFIRSDFNLSAIEAIRGGSASTFASNSPGGVINLISKTGDVEGGSIQASTGVNFGQKRVDFDYGSKLSDTVRFHIGGFYRSGEGPRHTGFDAYKGGQLKFNITKQLENGFIRVYGKFMDDHSPQYTPVPFKISGSNADPIFTNYAGVDLLRDASLSSYIPTQITLDGDNQPVRTSTSDGLHAVVKSIGLEGQFEVAGWTITDRLRYSDMSGGSLRLQPSSVDTAANLANTNGGAGAILSYATGPKAGQVIADPAGLNGNGLLQSSLLINTNIRSVNNFTNDLRANRQWKVGNGDLTITGGLYKTRQTIQTDWLYTNVLQEVRGDGKAALVNVTNAAGVPQTQDGFIAYGLSAAAGTFRRAYDVDYDITAPYGSANYHFGKIAIGGSLRYDIGRVNGAIYGADLGGGRVGVTGYDFNGDGALSVAEKKAGFIPVTRPAPVSYKYKYLSYSGGINYRIADSLAVFARYSKGARANADKILYTTAVSYTDGSLPLDSDAQDPVRQAELGMKFRTSDFNINVTGFKAKATDHNVQAGNGLQVIRDYSAYGVELEAGYQIGPFSLTAGGTYTHATIVKDYLVSTVDGNTPRHQPKFIFEATPQYETEHLTVGLNVVGNTSSFAGDANALKMPGFTVVNAFLQIRPTDRMQVMLNVNNAFNKVGFFDINQATIPASGIGWGRSVTGRTLSAAVKFDF